MVLTTLFIFLLAITVILTGMQIIGFEVLNSLIIMIVVDFMALGATLQTKKKNPGNPHNPNQNIIPRLENIEKTCSDIITHLGSNSVREDVMKSKDDITYLLERIARKTLDLENKMDTFGKTLARSMLDINGRVKNLEATEAVEKLEEDAQLGPDPVSVGEIVYVEDNSS